MIRVPGFRWGIVLLLFLGTTLSFFDRQILSVLAPAIQKDLGIDDRSYSHVVMAFLLSYTLMFTLGGRFLDRVGTRLGLFLCVGVWSAASALHAGARNALHLGIFRFLLGLGEGGCIPGVTKGAIEWFPLRQRSRAIGIAIGGAAIGSLLAPPLAVWMEAHAGWRGAFLATGILGLAWVGLWLLLYRRPRESPSVTPEELAFIEDASGGTRTLPPEEAAWQETLIPWRRLLRLREVWGLMATRFLLDPVFYLYMFWIPKYLSHSRGASLAEIGRLAWIPFLTLDVANLLGGWASDRLVRLGLPVPRARKTVMGIAAALTPVSILAMFVESLPGAVLLLGVLMFAHGFWITNYMTLTGDLLPRRSVGTVVGLCGSAGGIGGFLTTWIVGIVSERWSLVPIFIAAGVMYPLGFLVILGTVGRAGRVRV